MDKSQCIKLIEENFIIRSDISSFTNMDFNMTSRIFYYRDTFKNVGKIKIATITSKNIPNDIVMDLYFISDEFKDLCSGYFEIKAVSENSKKLLKGVSKITTDLKEYFYYLYKNSEFLKIYFISKNGENIEVENKDDMLAKIFKSGEKQIGNLTAEEFKNSLLERKFTYKYIDLFIQSDEKLTEEVRMFLINILNDTYNKNIVLVNRKNKLQHIIKVDYKEVKLNEKNITAYDMLDYSKDNNKIIYIYLDFSFKGWR